MKVRISNLFAHGVLILLFALLAPRLGMPYFALACAVIAVSVIAVLGELEDRSGRRAGNDDRSARACLLIPGLKYKERVAGAAGEEGMSPEELQNALTAVCLALEASHGCVATDLPEATPNDTSWVIDNANALKQAKALSDHLGVSTDNDL